VDQRPRFDANYLVGIAQIDHEHERLFAIAARTYDSLAASDEAGRAMMRAAVAELIDYTATHFASEESLMAAAAYPELPAHRDQHQHLLARARDMEMRVEIEDPGVAVDLTHFLYRWLVEHIEASDRKFGAYLRAR